MIKSGMSAIGLVRGPGDSPHSMTVVSSDDKRQLKIGEFITYTVQVEDHEQIVLARVIERKPLRLYPSSFLADPDLSPDTLATVLGYEGPHSELFEFIVETIGYFDPGLRDFVNPRLVPKSGSPVFLAPDAFLSKVLSRRETGQTGAAHIGSLLSRPEGHVPIYLDLDAICSTHLAIIASTGAGKSYLAGVLIEEMLNVQNRAALLVIDPHGEYDTLADMHTKLAQGDYSPEIEIYRPGQVKIRVGSLSMADLRYLLPDLSDRMEYVLRLAFRRVQNQSRRQHAGDPDRWRLEELCAELRTIGQLEDPENDESESSEEGGKYKDTADAVLWRLNTTLDNNQVFDNLLQTDIRELVHPGKCAVLQLNQVDSRQQQVIVATLLRRLYTARVQTERRQASGDENRELYLPYPVYVLIEEAHHFAPAKGDAITTEILKTILSEGRKFGLGVGLISQRPGKLDADVLSQCNTQFLMRIVNPVDQARVRESVESVGQELIDELPALTKGQAIVAGAAISTPVICRVRTRLTPHGAENISASQQWMTYFSEAETERRKRANTKEEVISPKSKKYKT